MDISDESIVAAIIDGDTEKFGILISRYESKLKRYARKFLAREEDIEDLLQDVFIKAYENLQSFDQSRSFSPWIYRIAHNVFVNELRRNQRFKLSSFSTDAIWPTLPAQETADGPAIEAEIKQEIEQILEQLSPKYREVLVLYYYEDLSYQEISQILQISVTTVGARISRARTKAKQLIDNQP